MNKTPEGPPPPAAAFAVRLAKESFTFAAAHFITYDGDVCEPLHGHNYRVVVELAGPLDANHYVLDFVATRDAVAEVAAELDHRTLLPTQHPTIRVERVAGPTGPEVSATHGPRRWVFPESDCVLLDVPNTTAERLAEWMARRLWSRFPGLTALTVEVDECEGQVGLCRLGG